MNISTQSNNYSFEDMLMFKLDLEDTPDFSYTEQKETPHPYLSVEIPEHFDQKTYRKLEETRDFIRELNAKKFIAHQAGNLKMANIYCRMLRNAREYRDFLYNHLYKEDTTK